MKETAMLRNYIKTAIRNLLNSRLHSTINILGLAVGITSIIIIFLIIKFEKSFDNFHEDKELIFRIVKIDHEYGETNYDEGIPYPLPEAVRSDFPELEYVTITDANTGIPVVSFKNEHGNKIKFKDDIKPMFTQPEFFKIFNYEWLSGDMKTALEAPKTLVISRKLAMTYFNTIDVVGKVVKLDGNSDFTIKGVIENPPANSDFPFHMYISFNLGSDKRGWDGWTAVASPVNCYIKLKPKTDWRLLEEKLNGWHHKYYDEDEQDDAQAHEYRLQPLTDLHSDTSFDNYNNRTVSDSTLMALALIGLFIMLTACINFINLNTVLIVRRSKEVGVRKVLGSNRFQLTIQFLGETAIITMLALLLSLGLTELILLKVSTIIGYQLEFEPVNNLPTITFLAIIFVVINLLAGIYPSLVLSGLQPIKALKNQISSNYGEKINLRRALIVVQLFIAQVLIVCTIVVTNQMDYFLNKSMGFEKEAVVEFDLPELENEQWRLTKNRFEKVQGVASVAFSNTGTASENTWGGVMRHEHNGQLIEDNAQVKFIDESYLDTYKLQLVAGNNVPLVDSVKRYLINEDAVRSMGYDNPIDAIGKEISIWGKKRQGTVVGVVRNFNTIPLHNKVEPVVLLSQMNYSIAAIKLSGRDYKQTIADVQKVWEEQYPDYVFEYSFLDDTVANFYDRERQTSQLFQLFSIVAIFIGMIGLFGLVSFMATQRTKEVGIRKALGASVSNIIMLFTKEFILLVFVGFSIAAPIAWYVMQIWLSNFAYRIDPGLGTFLLAITAVLLIVLSTVGFKSMQAATANPVDALKDE